MKKNIKQLIRELNQSTLNVKKVGKDKYKVEDVVEFEGAGYLNEKQLLKKFGGRV